MRKGGFGEAPPEKRTCCCRSDSIFPDRECASAAVHIGLGKAVAEAQSADAERAAAAPLTYHARVLNLAHKLVAEQASELFCENVLQNVLVEAQIGAELHELMVLVFDVRFGDIISTSPSALPADLAS